MAERVLDMENLHVSFDTYAGEVKAVRGVTLHVDEGEVLAIVGESGCGKSVTAQTIMKLNPMPPARIVEGSINLAGHDVVKASEKEMQKIILYRWNRVYPADLYFDIDLKNWHIKESNDFAGSSHDKITEEVYVK